MIGRKSRFFSGSPKGVTASESIYTLIEIAKVNGLNPTKYIQFILSDINGSILLEHPEFLKDYMPWNPIIHDANNKKVIFINR